MPPSAQDGNRAGNCRPRDDELLPPLAPGIARVRPEAMRRPRKSRAAARAVHAYGTRRLVRQLLSSGAL
ncbi:hypothetical protein ACVBGC_23040 [Burkholderia stagnalis]